MAWQLQWGAHVKVLEDRARRTGRKPAALSKRPTIRITDTPYAEAFFSLHASRTFGYSAPNPIAIHEISAYCQLQGIASPEERAKYLRQIQLLDQTYLKHWEKQNSNRPVPNGGKASRRS